MKIKSEHYDYMSKAIFSLEDPPTLDSYKAQNMPDMRWRWDLMYKAKLRDWVSINLYSYLDDLHIDTALRKIVRDMDRQKEIAVLALEAVRTAKNLKAKAKRIAKDSSRIRYLMLIRLDHRHYLSAAYYYSIDDFLACNKGSFYDRATLKLSLTHQEPPMVQPVDYEK